MLIFGLEVRDFRRENYGKTPSKYGIHGEFPPVTSSCCGILSNTQNRCFCHQMASLNQDNSDEERKRIDYRPLHDPWESEDDIPLI